MERVRINRGKIGMVFKNKEYNRMLREGVHWIGLFENKEIFDATEIYQTTKKMENVLEIEQNNTLIQEVFVRNNEIVLVYKRGNFDKVLTKGSYFYFTENTQFTFTTVDLSKVEITEDIDKTVLKSANLFQYVRTFKVEAFEEALLFVEGKYNSKLTAGTYLFWKNTMHVEMKKVDKRQLQMELSGQEILTKDKASLRLSLFTQYKVIDVEKALLNSRDFTNQLYIMIQLTLREFVGTKTFDELLENKDAAADFILKNMRIKAANMGVVLLDAGIRDIILSGEMKAIMNEVLIAQKQAQANVIARREETASTRSMLNQAKLMEENEMLFRLKEMEYVEKIADKIGEITVAGNGQVLDQLKGIFATTKN